MCGPEVWGPTEAKAHIPKWWGYRGEKGTADIICRSQWGPGEEEVLERVTRSLQETVQGNNLFWKICKCLSSVQGAVEEEPDHLVQIPAPALTNHGPPASYVPCSQGDCEDALRQTMCSTEQGSCHMLSKW